MNNVNKFINQIYYKTKFSIVVILAYTLFVLNAKLYGMNL